MDEKTFKKHLSALAHGHHHPEEHDWQSDSPISQPSAKTAVKKKAPSKRAPKKK